MATNRLWRTLSAFNPSEYGHPYLRETHRAKSRRGFLSHHGTSTPSPRGSSHAPNSFDHILEGPKSPDVIPPPEVTPDVRASLLDDARVRAAFLATDAEDQTSFERVPFATMTFLSTARSASSLDSQKEGDGIEGGEKLMFWRISRVTLPSKYGRDVLCVDIVPSTSPGTFFRLINVHIDSLRDTLHYRAQQMKILSDVLRELGCGGGIIAGDFNAISPEDDGLVDKSELKFLPHLYRP
ncbi:hypothetical protein EDB85DRAFT_2197972 [Lactarius pseudohatsudake]|nr:hypothetical protein EDB85DRAFT_2197972 [Lactarius pseudohatsudake]